ALLLVHLRFEAPALLDRIGELAEAVGELDAAGIELEALGDAGVVRRGAGERGFAAGILIEDRRRTVAELPLHRGDQHLAEDVRPVVVIGDSEAGAPRPGRQRIAV